MLRGLPRAIRLDDQRLVAAVACASVRCRLNYANAYNRMLKPAMRAAGIDDGAFHRLRHTCGTELRRRDASLEEIQLHLGHGDMGFTRRVYVHLDAEDGPDPTLLDDLSGCAPAPRRLKVAS